MSEGFTSYFVYEFLHQRYPHLTDSEYYMRLIHLVNKQVYFIVRDDCLGRMEVGPNMFLAVHD